MADNQSAARRGRALGFRVLVILAVLAISAGPLVLHFGQKRHNGLPFEVAARFPDNMTIVGGEVFATTVAELVDHELRGGTGWRPNDFILWGPTLWADNNSNRQLGIILAVRESVRVFKDHLTKVSSDQYDENLVAADTAFRNDAFKLWLPSAESKYSEGVKRLRSYVEGLKTTPMRSRPINQRNMELIRLMQAWGDLLGDAHAMLYRNPESMWLTDDDFYHAQGVTHVILHLSRAIEREYRTSFEAKPIIHTLFEEIGVALDQAAHLKPLIVFNSGPSGIFANHRRNLDAYISEARQKIYSIREELGPSTRP